MFDMVLNGFAMFWYPWPLALLNPQTKPYKTSWLSMTRHEVGHHCSHCQSVALQLECHLGWEQGKRMRNMRSSKKFWPPIMVFHHFPSCFQTGLVQTSSILVLDHPWFNSVVPCLTWFWMVLLCFDTPGLWHCWTHLNPPHNKTIQNQPMRNMRSSHNFSHPSWFPSFPIMFLNRSCPNLFYFSTGPPLV
jgi:hypothetical protein